MLKKFWGLQVEYLPVAVLAPDPRNPRTHSRRQLRMITASLREFGFVNPILIDRDNQIIAGHGRWEAAKAEGYPQVPTIRLEHLTEKQRRAYVIADNKLAEKAGWDREMLVVELGALIELDCELETIGFEPADIDILNSEIGGSGLGIIILPRERIGIFRGCGVRLYSSRGVARWTLFIDHSGAAR
jgi:hypothetical protein